MSINTYTARSNQLIDVCEGWFQREPVWARLTVAVLAFIPALLILAFFDDRTINEVNVWRKPLKFHLAVALYIATLTWFCGWINRSAKTRWWYRAFIYITVLCVVIELCWLSTASIIGEPSHYNRSHPILAPMYPLMGMIAFVFTSATVFVVALIISNRQSILGAYFRYSVVSGLIISFVFTVFIAGELASMDSHWIGGTRSDATGLWLLGWSRDGGDLRVAHFFSLHAMQFIPLAALIALPRRWTIYPRSACAVLSILYIAFILLVYFQAKMGEPFLPWLAAR